MSVQVFDAEIHVGALAPYAFRYNATSADATNFDLSTATGGEFRITREDGNPDTWAATLTPISTTAALLVHVFAAGDVDRIEVLTITPVFFTPSGDFFCESRKLSVKPPSEL